MSNQLKRIIIGALATVVLSLGANATITDALKVRVTGSTSDETVIRFLAGATAGFDGSYDAYKMFSSSPTVPAIFTAIDPANPLSINALPALTAFTDVEVFIHVKVAGNYTLQSIETGAFLPTTRIVLEDKLDGTLYAFRNGTSITFPMTVNTVSGPSRFVIHFRPAEPTVSTARYDTAIPRIYSTDANTTEIAQSERSIETTEEPAPAAVTAFIRDGALQLGLETASTATVSIMVYNINGQKIYSTSRSGSFSEAVTLNTAGTYIIYSVINNIPSSLKINYIN